MTCFIQLHLLTTYPPSNPNRDDIGQPKTARFGNAQRMRISSQSLKHALRTSSVFDRRLAGQVGGRTQRFGEVVEAHLLGKGAAPDRALEIAKAIANVFGKVDDSSKHHEARLRQLAFISPDEQRAAKDLAEKVLEGEPVPGGADLKKLILRTADGAVDIAMFGRMLADDPDFNREAAVQIAHAITTNKVGIENDFYTAVDDLKKPAEDAGAGFMGELGFGSGVFYIYANIDRDLLVENLDGDETLANTAIEALVEALATSSPSGKKNSFAHGGLAEYILAEVGSQQSRTLAGAFLKPVHDEDLMHASIKRLEAFCADMDEAYGPRADSRAVMITGGRESALQIAPVDMAGIADFCASQRGEAV